MANIVPPAPALPRTIYRQVAQWWTGNAELDPRSPVIKLQTLNADGNHQAILAELNNIYANTNNEISLLFANDNNEGFKIIQNYITSGAFDGPIKDQATKILVKHIRHSQLRELSQGSPDEAGFVKQGRTDFLNALCDYFAPIDGKSREKRALKVIESAGFLYTRSGEDAQIDTTDTAGPTNAPNPLVSLPNAFRFLQRTREGRLIHSLLETEGFLAFNEELCQGALTTEPNPALFGKARLLSSMAERHLRLAKLDPQARTLHLRHAGTFEEVKLTQDKEGKANPVELEFLKSLGYTDEDAKNFSFCFQDMIRDLYQLNEPNQLNQGRYAAMRKYLAAWGLLNLRKEMLRNDTNLSDKQVQLPLTNTVILKSERDRRIGEVQGQLNLMARIIQDPTLIDPSGNAQQLIQDLAHTQMRDIMITSAMLNLNIDRYAVNKLLDAHAQSYQREWGKAKPTALDRTAVTDLRGLTEHVDRTRKEADVHLSTFADEFLTALNFETEKKRHSLVSEQEIERFMNGLRDHFKTALEDGSAANKESKAAGLSDEIDELKDDQWDSAHAGGDRPYAANMRAAFIAYLNKPENSVIRIKFDQIFEKKKPGDIPLPHCNQYDGYLDLCLQAVREQRKKPEELGNSVEAYIRGGKAIDAINQLLREQDANLRPAKLALKNLILERDHKEIGCRIGDERYGFTLGLIHAQQSAPDLSQIPVPGKTILAASEYLLEIQSKIPESERAEAQKFIYMNILGLDASQADGLVARSTEIINHLQGKLGKGSRDLREICNTIVPRDGLAVNAIGEFAYQAFVNRSTRRIEYDIHDARSRVLRGRTANIRQLVGSLFGSFNISDNDVEVAGEVRGFLDNFDVTDLTGLSDDDASQKLGEMRKAMMEKFPVLRDLYSQMLDDCPDEGMWMDQYFRDNSMDYLSMFAELWQQVLQSILDMVRPQVQRSNRDNRKTPPGQSA